MRCHIYFLQDEYDAIRFLDALSELHAIVWTGSALKSPLELKDEIKNQMSSFFVGIQLFRKQKWTLIA